MANRLEDLGKVTASAARKYAGRQAEAGARYVDSLQKFSQGKTTVGKYTAEIAGLTLREGVRSAEAYVTASSDWLQEVFTIIGGKKTATDAEKKVRDVTATGTVKDGAVRPPTK